MTYNDPYPNQPKRKPIDGNRHRKRYAENRDAQLAYNKARYIKEKDKLRAESKKWLDAHPEQRREYVRASQTKRRYGLTREQHRALYAAQNGCCAICKIEETKLKRRLCIDHDHKTNKVRGLICHPCNVIIGHAGEKTETLIETILYLERHRRG
jgi:hypothetical protein